MAKNVNIGSKVSIAIVKETTNLESYTKHSRISEDRIREWFDNNLITSNQTRGSVMRGHLSTNGMPNN